VQVADDSVILPGSWAAVTANVKTPRYVTTFATQLTRLGWNLYDQHSRAPCSPYWRASRLMADTLLSAELARVIMRLDWAMTGDQDRQVCAPRPGCGPGDEGS
jgi:hypothetical protein